MIEHIKATKLMRINLFLVILILAVENISWVFYPANNIVNNWRSFYAQDRNSIDYLFIGNSHAFASFDVTLVSENTGKRSYTLASNSQNVTQAYYNVRESLKYQSPELIILEASSINDNSNWQNGMPEDKTYDKDWKKESNIDGMRVGIVKLESIMTQYKKENWSYAIFRITRSHMNWKNPEIMYQNWYFRKYDAKKFNGFSPAKSQMSEETQNEYRKMGLDSSTYKISAVNEKHFHKLAKLCSKKGIQLLVIMAPMYDGYTDKINYSSRYEAVKALAQSENVKYIDCNVAEVYKEIGLEPQDFEDSVSTYIHLNNSGAEKVSQYISERLDNYV